MCTSVTAYPLFLSADEAEGLALLTLYDFETGLRDNRFCDVNHRPNIDERKPAAWREDADHLTHCLFLVRALCADVMERKARYDDIESGIVKMQIAGIH